MDIRSMLCRTINTSRPMLVHRSLSCANKPSPVSFHRTNSTETPKCKEIRPEELEELLAEPTWSVESLLPPKSRALDAPQTTSEQLHHLLRLSALPPPETPEAEQKMLDTLVEQLHFVGKIQEVDTTGVEPLRAIRDETKAAEEEQTITVSTLKEAFEKEKVVGQHYKRIKRRTTPVRAGDVEEWDVLGSAQRTAGKYFVVDSQPPTKRSYATDRKLHMTSKR